VSVILRKKCVFTCVLFRTVSKIELFHCTVPKLLIRERFYILLLFFCFPLAVQPSWTQTSDFQFYDHFTDCRSPWTSDQFVARPLPKHRTTQTQNKHIHVPNIHAFCRFEPTIPASKRAKTVHASDPSATVTGHLLIPVFIIQVTKFTQYNTFSKIPPSTPMHFATRVRTWECCLCVQCTVYCTGKQLYLGNLSE
jgi:hypothetical protein